MKRLWARIAAVWCRVAHSERALLKEGRGYRCQVCLLWTPAPWAVPGELERVRAEQRQAVRHLEAGEGFVAALGACDWMAEELALLREANGR